MIYKTGLRTSVLSEASWPTVICAGKELHMYLCNPLVLVILVSGIGVVCVPESRSVLSQNKTNNSVLYICLASRFVGWLIEPRDLYHG